MGIAARIGLEILQRGQSRCWQCDSQEPAEIGLLVEKIRTIEEMWLDGGS